MKTRNKRLPVILGIVIPVVLIIAVLLSLVVGYPITVSKQIAVTVDNSYRNSSRTYSLDVAAGEGTVFFKAYNRGIGFDNGIYQINGSIAHRVYRMDFSIMPNIPFSPYVYQGRLVSADNGTICALNFSNGELEPFLDPPLKNGETVSQVFTLNGELYYVDGSDNIYQYSDNEINIAASDELCGYDYVPYDFCNDTMYYYTDKTKTNVPNDYKTELYDCGFRKLYEYDLSKKKIKRCIDFSCIDDILPEKNCAVEDCFVAEDQVYLTVKTLEDLETHYSKEVIEYDSMLQDIGYAQKSTIYRYDIGDEKPITLADFNDSSISFNGYGSNVYIFVVTEYSFGSSGMLKDSIYSLSKDSDGPKLLPTEEYISSIYIFDEEWLYYTTGSNKLYRIHPNGSDNESVF